MVLSSLRVRDVGIFVHHKDLGRFMVINRIPEDRCSGITEIQYETSKRIETFVWDSSDPEVESVGTGKIIPQRIVFPRT